MHSLRNTQTEPLPKISTKTPKKFLACISTRFCLIPYAQTLLGFAYYLGRGVPKDYVEARKWFLKAAQQGDADAQWILGTIYAEGKGVPKNYIQAYKWLNLSAAQGREDSIKELREIESKMTPGQVAEAQALSTKWKPKKGK